MSRSHLGLTSLSLVQARPIFLQVIELDFFAEKYSEDAKTGHSNAGNILAVWFLNSRPFKNQTF